MQSRESTLKHKIHLMRRLCQPIRFIYAKHNVALHSIEMWYTFLLHSHAKWPALKYLSLMTFVFCVPKMANWAKVRYWKQWERAQHANWTICYDEILLMLWFSESDFTETKTSIKYVKCWYRMWVGLNLALICQAKNTYTHSTLDILDFEWYSMLYLLVNCR